MRKISYQIVLITIICILLTGSLIGYLSIMRATQSVKNQTDQYLIAQAEAYAKEIEKITTQTRMIVSDANSIITAKANDIDLDEDLNNFIDYSKNIIYKMANNVTFNTNIYVTLIPAYEKEGKLVNLVYMRQGESFYFDPLPWYVDRMEEQAEELIWFTEPIRLGRGYWSKMYYDPNIELWMVSYCEPIQTQEGIIGIVGMDINLEYLNKIIGEAKFFDTGYASLVDQEMYFISHPVYENTQHLDEVASGQFKTLADVIDFKSMGVLSYEVDGESRITGYAPVEEEFTVFTTIYEDEVMSVVTQLQLQILLVILGVITMLVMVAFLLGRRIARPIELAAEHAQKIALGEFESDFSEDIINRQDEIGLLGVSLTEMTLNLEAMIKERDGALLKLEEINSELERRVYNRTIELEKVNFELHEILNELLDTQSQLVRVEKLSALRHLTAGLAHEINTPVGICITASSYLKRISKTMLEQLEMDEREHESYIAYVREGKDIASLIENNLNSTVKLIDRLKIYLELKKIDSGIGFNVLECVNDIIANIKNQLGRNQEIHLMCSPQIAIRGDSKAFVSIIEALIDNSINHGFEKDMHGLIEIEVYEGKEIKVVFKDNGIGISDHENDKIFNPFYTTKRGKGNMGLGLFSVYEIITLYFEGSIELETSSDRGTCFTMTFPKNE